MKRITIVSFLCLTINSFLLAQNKISFSIKDVITQERLKGVSVSILKSNLGSSSDSSGMVVIKNIPDGKQIFNFSSIGYKELSFEIIFPIQPADSVFEILMEQDVKEENQVIVSSSRTESRIENTPTRVEVLGSEEVNEEVGIKPGNIASLLGDIAGIQTQQTSASTGNIEMRVQGLPGKYTQLLRDGMPLFGGYSGSFSILQIPPLDLKQIEIVKGSVSTLYGGGAIAGMINLISKKPKEGIFEKTILLNQSSLKESNVNIYLSQRRNKTGFTFFSGVTHQQQADVNKDGFSDLPLSNSYFIHPTIFFYPNKNVISIGYNGVYENRNGGDMLVLKNKGDNLHQYFNESKSNRHTTDINWENKINNNKKVDFKATTSLFDRSIETNVFGMKAKQLSWYTEISYLSKTKTSDWVLGVNFNGEDFRKKIPDSTHLNDETNTTIGAFAQNDWRISKQLTLETGLRFDHHNIYGNFVLPRFSLLYKISPYVTSRIGGGLGYKIPTVFSADIDERDYPLILPLNLAVGIKAEKSAGVNWDINFHKKLNTWETTINQTFYVTSIEHPVITSTTASNLIYFSNANRSITTYGFETYIQLQHDKLEIYLGYVYTIAKKLYDPVNSYLSLSARNKFASVLAYEFSGNFRAGIEAAFTGRQYLDNGDRTPAYPFIAGMMRYDIKRFAFVLNCENLFDYRQTKKESIIIPPLTNPTFKQLWAPIDGRVVNLSMRISL